MTIHTMAGFKSVFSLTFNIPLLSLPLPLPIPYQKRPMCYMELDANPPCFVAEVQMILLG